MFSLGFLQALSYAAPLLVLWAIGNSYTDAELGQFLIVQSVAAFGSIFIEFGFHMPAVRSASEAKRKNCLGDYLWDVHIAKLLLTIITIPLLLIFIVFEIDGGSSVILLFCAFLMCSANAFRPLWFFQTIDSFKTLLLFELTGTIIGFFFAIFSSFMKFDIVYVLLMWCLPRSILLIGLVLYCHIIYPAKIGNLKRSLIELKKNFKFFVSKFSTSAMHLTAPMILLLIIGPRAALTFQMAERIFTAFQTFLFVISQVTYPKIIQYASKEDTTTEKATPLIINTIQILLSLISSVFLLIFAPYLVKILWSENNQEVTTVLRILAVSIPFININIVIGFNYLIPRGMDYSVIIPALSGALCTISALFFLPRVLGASIGAWSILFGEFFAFLIITLAALRARYIAEQLVSLK